MTAHLPRKLSHFNVFVNSQTYFGKAEEVTLPKFALKTEDYRPGGYDGVTLLDMGMEKMEAEFTFASFDTAIMKLYGIRRSGMVDFLVRGAQTKQGISTAIVADIRGHIISGDPGSWKAGDNVSHKITVHCDYYRLEENGHEILEIDVHNMIRRIDGIDYLESARAAILR